MNVIGHYHIPPYTDSKVSCSSRVLDQGRVYLWRG
jgi:hypothetical protein